MKPRHLLLLSAVVALLAPPAGADPCGMVPPVYINDDVPIARVGLQQTYVFFKDGVEAFVIRPGFKGKTDEFGMLIPFPSPPAIRKVPDDVFPHIEKAIDPPEILVDLRPPPPRAAAARGGDAGAAPDPTSRPPLEFHQVRVLRQEAVGMYEVAVLEAGSAAALKKWMDDKGYKYPEGMDDVCNEYVEIQWCFVAIKTRVGQKAGVSPQPGQRNVNPKLPTGATFDGHVQAMGFRFRTDKLVVPMRLSAFNEGELRNVVYLLTDGPRRIRSIPEEYVVRQLSGEELHRNVTGPLPIRVIGGTVSQIPERRRKYLKQQRDPTPHNGHAKDLFASDMLAVKKERLSHPHEEAEKMLLRIGEHFGLRGKDIDRLNEGSLAGERTKAVASAVGDLKHVALTVIDGDFPREVLGGQNLTFAQYNMPARRNNPLNYDTKRHAPGHRQRGVRHRGTLSFNDQRLQGRLSQMRWQKVLGALAIAALVLVGMVAARRWQN